MWHAPDLLLLRVLFLAACKRSSWTLGATWCKRSKGIPFWRSFFCPCNFGVGVIRCCTTCILYRIQAKEDWNARCCLRILSWAFDFSLQARCPADYDMDS